MLKVPSINSKIKDNCLPFYSVILTNQWNTGTGEVKIGKSIHIFLKDANELKEIEKNLNKFIRQLERCGLKTEISTGTR